MNRKMFAVLCLFAAFLVFNSESFAQEQDRYGAGMASLTKDSKASLIEWAIGVRGSYYTLNAHEEEGLDFDPDGSLLFEGTLTCFLNKWSSLEFSFGYVNADYDAEVVGVGSAEFGELEQIPLVLTGRLHHKVPNTNAALYAGLGVGYYLNDFEVSSLFTSYAPGTYVSLDDSFGFHVTTGIDFGVSDNFGISLDVKYILWNEADFVLSVPSLGYGSGDIDLDGLVVGFSIKFFF